jgi:YtkA-like
MLRKLLLVLSLIGLASLTACMSPPKGLNLSLDRPTAHDTYRVAVRSLAEPIAINKIHAWEIQLRSPTGEPVPGARISADGGMPQHGHGFPTQPRVTKELGDGRYLLEGMKFSMPGWWEIKLKVDAPSGKDEVTFNTIIASGAAPAAVASNAAAR